jgi:hypothetical protein
MTRIAAIIGQGFSLWLLLLTTALPGVDCCVLRLFTCCPEEEREEKGGASEEQRAKEAVVHRGRCHRRHAHGCPVPELARHAVCQTPWNAAWLDSVCTADGIRGQDLLRNGCGAVLLR